MTRLLECQKAKIDPVEEAENLKTYSIALLCLLLEIFESDLTPEEDRQIERFAKDWCKK